MENTTPQDKEINTRDVRRVTTNFSISAQEKESSLSWRWVCPENEARMKKYLHTGLWRDRAEVVRSLEYEEPQR